MCDKRAGTFLYVLNASGDGKGPKRHDVDADIKLKLEHAAAVITKLSALNSEEDATLGTGTASSIQ